MGDQIFEIRTIEKNGSKIYIVRAAGEQVWKMIRLKSGEEIEIAPGIVIRSEIET